MTDLIDLHRTFSPAKEIKDEQDEWVQYLHDRDKSKLTWAKLYDNNVTVVVGEAGIGKTSEFKNEIKRLQEEQGESAFFIELNQLTAKDDWEILLLSQNNTDYTAWSNLSGVGYFFLDAIDESRLISHAAFRKALSIVAANFKPHLSRIKVAISSRWTDWGQKEVQDAVSELLVKPIDPQAEPFVVSLNPLSKTEAKRFASEKGVENGAVFWRAIDHGNYWHMATRPLDLEWLVSLWNLKKKFGKYLELIKGNVTNRLTETNPNYKTADKFQLSSKKLRRGAEKLAAAAEFSSRHHIATVSVPRDNEVVPSAVLTNWSEPEIMRLLASAIFDEATYGRVKFHHRSVREYLAACWVKRRIEKGWPLQKAIDLFAAAPFGELVLIPSRRWALCWLATINANVREWVTNNFPEMIAFDGDPESWDELSADRAFTAYLPQLQKGRNINDYKREHEYRRVGRRLPGGRIASLINESRLQKNIYIELLCYAKFAHLTDCAGLLFDIYKNINNSDNERRWALWTLEYLGTQEQRIKIKNDLLSGRLTTNEVIAAALPVIDWQSLTVEQLAGIFNTAGEEYDYSSEHIYGLEPMFDCLQDDLLPKSDADSAELLLNAVMAALPQSTPPKTWFTKATPLCFKRLLELLPQNSTNYPSVCIDALKYINPPEGYEREKFRDIIARHTNLRWQVSLTLPDSENCWYKDANCLVTFDWDDLSELTQRANDLTLTKSERDIWFHNAFNVAFYTPAILRKSSRTKAVQALAIGPEKIWRQKHIKTCRKEHIHFLQKQRNWRSEKRRKKREERQELNDKLLSAIKNIRDGSNRKLLERLLEYSYKHSRHSSSSIDFEPIKKHFGQDVTDALTAGLKKYWRTTPVVTQTTYRNDLLIALTAELENDLDIISSFNSEEATQAACIIASCAWQNSIVWFDRLIEVHEPAVFEALHPWIETENQSTIKFVLDCSCQTRVKLLQPIIPLVKNGEIQNVELLFSLAKTLHEDGQLSSADITNLCKSQVKLLDSDQQIKEVHWLCLWLAIDILAAWNWFEEHLNQIGKNVNKQLEAFARTSGYESPYWIQMQPDQIEHAADVLIQLFNRLSTYIYSAKEAGDNKKIIRELRYHIINMLVQTPGQAAHDILTKLAEDNKSNQKIRDWLLAERTKHAAHTAQAAAIIEPAKLRNIGSVFQTNPQSEAQLFQQVLARLEEIKKGIEEGPFSERCLFWPGMAEKDLQHWLAAKLRDTQNRRFSVHREEEVDNDKKTDIQVSCKHGNVCIEIKPVDQLTTRRKYSANFLTKDTLRRQLAGQYLKGYNSQHGILVLFRLDQKRWNIPGGKNGQPLSALVEYLQQQADSIKAASASVQALHVIGIDCVAPKKKS